MRDLSVARIDFSRRRVEREESLTELCSAHSLATFSVFPDKIFSPNKRK